MHLRIPFIETALKWSFHCLLIFITAVYSWPVSSQNTIFPSASTQNLLLRGATIFTIGEEGELPIGDILIRDNRILAVASDLSSHPLYDSAQVVNLYGKVITPGFIAPWSPTGLTGKPLTYRADHSQTLSASFEVADSWIAAADSVRNALEHGFTIAHPVPQKPGSLFSGKGALISTDVGLGTATKTDTRRLEKDATLSRDTAVVVRLDQLGETPQLGVQALEYALEEVKRYQRHRLTIERGGYYDFADTRQDLQVLQRVIGEELALLVVAYGEREIRLLVEMSQRLGVRLIIAGGLGAGPVAKELRDSGIPVILNLMDAPLQGVQIDPLEAWQVAALLEQEGVTVLFGSDSADVAMESRVAAGLAVAWGMSKAAARKGLTLEAAKVLGLPERGQIVPGKIADLVIWTGDPLEMDSYVERVYHEGVVSYDRETTK